MVASIRVELGVEMRLVRRARHVFLSLPCLRSMADRGVGADLGSSA